MAKSRNTRRAKPKDANRRSKKKISPLTADEIEYLDYKDVDTLRRFMSDRAKIRSRRVSGNDSQQQRVVARAIKNAREMGLLPYASRVTTQRRARGDRPERGDRRPRGDRDENREGRDDAPRPDGDAAAPAEAPATEAPAAEAPASEAPAAEVAAEGAEA